jgi:hypothetical protein
MMAFLIIALLVTVVAVIVAFVLGMTALSLAGGHAESSSLKLIALNLLEPGVTIFVLFAAISASRATSSPLMAILISGIPLTLMLLAPLFVQARHPIRVTLITYGLLRWANTVAMWVFLKIIESQTLAGVFVLSGTVLLCVNISRLASSLNDFKPKSALSTATDSPRA